MMHRERRAWGQTLFCDDIRHELGGKYSLIGVYSAELVTQLAFPFIMPKIIMYIQYLELKESFSEDLTLKIYLPHDSEDASIVMPIPRSRFDQAATPSIFDKEAEALYNVTVPLTFAPFQILKEGSIKVRMECGDVETKLGRLIIRSAKEGEATFGPTASPQPPSPPPPTAPAS